MLVVLFKVYTGSLPPKTPIIDPAEILSQQQGHLPPTIASDAAAPTPTEQHKDSDIDISPLPETKLGETNAGERVKATFITLARNTDVWEIAKSIRHVEDRFNRKFHYDWVFLNDKPFDSTFKKVTTALVSGKTFYGEIPAEHWSFPEWIDKAKAKKTREDMVG